MGNIRLDAILDRAFAAGASHIQLNAGKEPQLVIAKKLVTAKDVMEVQTDDENIRKPAFRGTKALDNDDMVSLMKSITPEIYQADLTDTGTTRFGFAYGEAGRLVANVFRQRGDLAITMKLVAPKPKTFPELGIKTQMEVLLCGREDGLIVTASPQGHGRTTLIASIIDHYNKTVPLTIATLEGPVEYFHQPEKAMIRQHEIGNDIESFTTPVVKLGNPNIVSFGDDINTNEDVLHAAMDAMTAGALVLATYKGMTMDSGQIRDDIAEKIGSSMGSSTRLAFLQSAYGAITQRIDHSNTPPKVSCTISRPYENDTKDGTYLQNSADLPFMGTWAGPAPGINE